MKRLEFIYHSEKSDKIYVQNVLVMLKEAKKIGIPYKLIDLRGKNKGEIFELYLKGIGPCLRKKYQIRTVFGSHKHPATEFGTRVPALFVYEGQDFHPCDVFPHISKGKEVGIEQGLEEILKCGWKNIVLKLVSYPPHKKIILIPKYLIPHPRLAGAKKRLGDIKLGKETDWEFLLPKGQSFHIEEYRDHYEVHLDYISPSVNWWAHIKEDAPHWIWIGLLALLAIHVFKKEKNEEE